MKDSLNYSVRAVLDQGLLFLDRLSDETYARPLGGVFESSLGAHYRHVLDHFLSLIDGVRSGLVNYDQRRRDPLLECCVLQARLATEVLIAQFCDLPSEFLRRECVVSYQVDYRQAGEAAVTSNVRREVMFCVGHAIHHYAIIKLLCATEGIELPYEFGVAPSTLKHLEITEED